MNHHWIYPLIGERIRQRRKRFKWTQEKLAARMGMSRASLANIETGRQNVLVHQLYGFAEALGLSPTDILPEKSEQRESHPLDDLPLPEGLNSQQKDQISRLLTAPPTEASRLKVGTHAKQTKR